MGDPLYQLLRSGNSMKDELNVEESTKETEASTKYLTRLLSLRLSDLTTTEPQSLSQAHHSNHVQLQALSSRSYKTTSASASHLSVLHASLPSITRNIDEVREAIPALDESAVSFASTYSRSRDHENVLLQTRKESMLLALQSDKLTDILELPSLLSTAIASAGSGVAGSANYSQALDLFAHIKRLSINYPDSAIVKSVQGEAEEAMKSMTTNLIANLRSQNIRLAAAIRTVGWLRRVVPELSNQPLAASVADKSGTGFHPLQSLGPSPLQSTISDQSQSEGSLGALFLVSRLHTFLTMTEALAPLRDLADQESARRASSKQAIDTNSAQTRGTKPQPSRRASQSAPASQGTHTERYLKRYIEIFREQSFSTISMYRNIFPPTLDSGSASTGETGNIDLLTLPSALQQFPMHLIDIFIESLQTYLPNVTDPAARESLLMQVLYAANSLGRLGADFSMMISVLDEEDEVTKKVKVGEMVEIREDGQEDTVKQEKADDTEPEWARIIKKHRVQAARLDALATGNPTSPSRSTADIAVR